MFFKCMSYALVALSLSASFSKAAVGYDKRRTTKGGSLWPLVKGHVDDYLADGDGVSSLSEAFERVSLVSPRFSAAAAASKDSTDDSGSVDSAPIYGIAYSVGARTPSTAASSSGADSDDVASETESVESLSDVVIPEENRAVLEAFQNCMYCISTVSCFNLFVSRINTDLRAIVDRVDSGRYSESAVILDLNSVGEALNKAEEKMLIARSFQETMAPLRGISADSFEDIGTRNMTTLIIDSVEVVSNLVHEIERRIAALRRTLESVELRVIEDDELKDASRVIAGSAEFKASRAKGRARKFGHA